MSDKPRRKRRLWLWALFVASVPVFYYPSYPWISMGMEKLGLIPSVPFMYYSRPWEWLVHDSPLSVLLSQYSVWCHELVDPGGLLRKAGGEG